MDETTEPSRRPSHKPRRSLTKTQLETPAGAELLSLCQTITEDGRVSEAEVTALRDWLSRNRDSGLPSEDFLIATVEEILADGRITHDELEDLHEALETVLPPDLRKGAQGKRREAAAEDRRLAKEQTAAAKEQAAAERERTRPVASYDFMVAGVGHDGRDEIIRDFMDGDDPNAIVYLARDPANEHSDNAVEVRLSEGECIGYVPERDNMAREIAEYLDTGHKHLAFIKKILTGGRSPIPVVVAHIIRPDAEVEGAVTQDEVPGESEGVPAPLSPSPEALGIAYVYKPPEAPPRRGIGRVIIGLIVIGLLAAVALMIARSS
jgi:hypothetical protein